MKWNVIYGNSNKPELIGMRFYIKMFSWNALLKTLGNFDSLCMGKMAEKETGSEPISVRDTTSDFIHFPGHTELPCIIQRSAL